MRLPDASRAAAVADALAEGGVTAVEMTFTTAGALEAIEAMRRTAGDRLLVGAGTTLLGLERLLDGAGGGYVGALRRLRAPLG